MSSSKAIPTMRSSGKAVFCEIGHGFGQYMLFGM
jgi:hypothetical protein